MHKSILTAAALALTVTTAPALAHSDDDGYRYEGSSRHSRFHDRLEDTHERAHEDGFSSRREHRAFHRALRYFHGEYHEENQPRSYYWWRRW